MRGRLRFSYPLGWMPILLLVTLATGSHALAQRAPATFRDFLSQYRGREIILLDRTSGVLQFDDPDSTTRYIVVLDDVDESVFVVHRGSLDHRSIYEYPLSKIRRITYLFDGRPYKRIVVESY